MSLGLKKYTHQLEQELVDAKFNVNTCDLNLIGVINVLATSGIAPINLNLIFNLENKDEDGLFGKGFKLDLYKKIESKGRDFKVTNADGSVDNYYEANGYYNKETKLTASEESTDEDVANYTFSLEDSGGKDIAFSSNEAEYPNYPFRIRVNSKVYYGVDFRSTPKAITNNKDKQAKFICDANGKVKTIEYCLGKDPSAKLKKSTEFTYVNGMINTITCYAYNDAGNKLCQSVYTISLSDTQMTISEKYSEEKLVYELSNKKVKAFYKYYGGVLDKTSQVKLSTVLGQTKITDYKGNSSYVIYENNLPCVFIDHEGNCQEASYDLETKEQVYKSDVIRYNQASGNILGSKNVTSLVKSSSLTISEGQITYPAYDAIIGESLSYVSGTGSLTKNISLAGLGGDTYEFVIFAGIRRSSTNKITVSLRANDNDESTRTIALTNSPRIISLGLRALKSYSTLSLTINLEGFDGYLGALRLYKKRIGTTAVYDNKGNITGQSNGVSKSSFKYNEKNQLSDVRSSQGIAYNIEYENGNVVLSTGAYGVITKNEYDENNNLVKTQKIKGNDKIEIDYTYDSNGYLASKMDELGHIERYENDSLGKILKSTDALSYASLYKYDNYMNLNNLILNNNHSTDYTYDTRHRLIEISNRNNIKYNFTYDNFNNVTKVELNGTTLFKFTYNDEMQLVSQQYGDNGDIYNFKYDTKGNIVEIKYGSSTRYKFNYNNLNQITSIVDQNGQLLSNYEYDINGNVTREYKTNMDLSYDYDREGNIIKSKREINNKKIYQSYDSLSRSQGAYPESIVSEFYDEEDMWVGDYISNCDLKRKDMISKCYDLNGNELNVKTYRIEAIPCMRFDKTVNRKLYRFTDKNTAGAKASIAMWFRPDNLDETKYLFSQKNTQGKGFIGVYIKDNKLHLALINDNGSLKDNLIVSSSNVKNGEWNFFALDYYFDSKPSDEFEYGRFSLMVNGTIDEFVPVIDGYSFTLDSTPNYNIGFSANNTNVSLFEGYIAVLLIANNTEVGMNRLMTYYKLTKDYFSDTLMKNDNRGTVNISQTKLYTIDSNIQNNYEIFPLQNDLKSLKGTLPTKYDIRTYAKHDNDRTFNFNNKNNHYSYVADGQPLEYNLSPKDSGTIMLRAYTNTKTDKQYFFEGFNDKQTLGLYRNANNKLCLDLDGKVVESSLTVSTGSWHTIGISYDTEDPNDSQVVFKYKNIRFFVDGLIDTKQVQTWFNYSSLSFMIGRSHNEIMINNIYNSYPLYGQIEMLVVSNYYVSEATLRNLANEMLGITKTNEYDQFGRFKYKSIENGNVIVSNEYSFKNSTNTSNVVSSEKIILNNSTLTRKYETNAVNNVTSITDSVFGSHNYTYDYRGFLTKEDDIEYKYNNNGNITKAGNDTFTYDNLNRLKTINGWPVSYSSTNPGNPATYRDTSYRFEGRKLTYVYESMGSDEDKTVDYTYDSNGLIIKKVLCYCYSDDRDPDEYTTNYYYDGDKLITQIKNNIRLDFLYDENGMLYGLIKDNSSKYFYVRDYLQNILGIVDQSGKLVVKYKYDAYGNSKGIEDTSGCSLGSRNPFRYKGYYYDDDTEMYYCKSRFYVPKWRRWLNNDSINYLEPQNITCLNLFAYCNNNPVMYVDPTGDFAISILALIIGGIIGACIGFGTAAYIDSKDGQMFNGDVKWYDYLGATALGGVVGALATIAFTASIPTFGLISSGGALSLGITGAAELTISGVQVLVGAGILGSIMCMSKNRPGMTHTPPFSWVSQEEGIEAMKKFNGDANKAADYIMNNKARVWKRGPGNDQNVIKKWLDRIIRALLGR